jgi:actin-related protein 4
VAHPAHPSSSDCSYAGEDSPKTVFPTSYATVPGTGDAEPSYYHGASVNLWRPNAVISNPISDGLINDWAAIERTLDHAFRDRMRLPSLEDHPLLVTEPSWNTDENRKQMCELAFEKWNAPAYYAVDRSVMSS